MGSINPNNQTEMDKIVSLCKRRGFIFPSSEIYGGLGSTWDYGPLGVELKNRVKAAWWRSVVYEREDMVGLDAAILMNPMVWKASGHIDSFYDTYLDCLNCKKRIKADDPQLKKASKTCPYCNKSGLTDSRKFNLMFKTHVGPLEEENSLAYLRPETAQGIFVNFLNILDTTRKKLPFGIAQIGKAFRNEITPGNFTFRTREFEQMEIEYFVKPGIDEQWHKDWIKERLDWYLKMGIKKENLRLRPHAKDELAHYAKACTDVEYNFPFSAKGGSASGGGWSELEGIANRADFDLKQHAKFSGKELSYTDEETKEKFIPYVIEPSGGVDRATLAFLIDAYREEKVKGEKRVVLGFSRQLAPLQIAVLPLLRNRPEIVELAKNIRQDLSRHFVVTYDDTASIGRLYRRQDEIGTLYCLTVDVQSLEDKQVTVRDRDSMQQDRIAVDRLKEYLTDKLA